MEKIQKKRYNQYSRYNTNKIAKGASSNISPTPSPSSSSPISPNILNDGDRNGSTIGQFNPNFRDWYIKNKMKWQNQIHTPF